MKRCLRWLLWKLCRRDFLVLHPDWEVVTRNAGYSLIGKNPTSGRRVLSMRYNYHTPKSWRLEYHIRGHASGSMRYTLGVPGKGPFCEVKTQVQLPLDWTVELDEPGLLFNGQHFSIMPGKTVPRDTSWLVGKFEFQSNEEAVMTRGTGHRVRTDDGESDGDYFNGSVYENYESQAGIFPKEILETIQQHHPLRGKLLDVGCATGLLVQEALAGGIEPEGIDVSPWAVERANVRTGGRCRILNLDEAKPSDFSAQYDIITLHSVIEHLADPAQALSLLFQITRPGGVVYIQTLNADSLMHKLLDSDWSGYTDYTHKSPWLTADWLAETSRRTGFEILSLKRYGVWNDNAHDEVWRSLASLIQIHPASAVLEDQFGDFVELILRRPERECSRPPEPLEGLATRE